MDPLVLGMLVLAGASTAVAMRIRWARRSGKQQPTAPQGSDGIRAENVRVGDVLTYLGEEFWLAGEVTLMREGVTVLRLFAAPERGRERWVALPKDGRSLWVLYVEPELSAVGWPGTEVPVGGRMLRRFEHGSVLLVPRGEGTSQWEGRGRFALLRAHDCVAAVIENSHKERLALMGREIPWQLVQKMG